MPDQPRMNRSQAQKVRKAVQALKETDLPTRPADARDVLAEIYEALTDLEAPLVELTRIGKVEHRDGDSAEMPAAVQRHIRQLRKALLHTLGQD